MSRFNCSAFVGVCSLLLFSFAPNTVASWEDLKSDALIEIKEASGFLPAIVQSNVNIRSKPSTDGKKLGLLQGGKSIRAEFLTDSDWARINFRGDGSYASQDAYVHKSALIKQVYKADINYEMNSNNSTVFAMSGWHYSYLPGSYFLSYQSNKYGIATFGPIDGSGYAAIGSYLYKVDYDKRDVYLATGHDSGNRTYYTPYLAFPTEKELVVYQLPTFTSNDSNSLSIDGDTLIYEGKSYSSCCDYEKFELRFNLADLSYEGSEYYYDRDSENENPPLERGKLQLYLKKIPMEKSR
ncbi:SH3 domain-containing protein [Psychrosphaera sp. B3R10]|uniref:SH3 domain-containing protein n=1 Tax=unclassified Psychrosphaera TaxID=2641570 RepID=UPI001C0861AA|nr:MULTISPECIES: SH3 domain-containing protein [unclassified Psychrosphaera]MBU2880467.1 SH3 domain-containing protein [Psychrosphaera sp. I2R16]MBU2991432.1 SH3 domain-containing protein [Psychrosphaera sp. B3R10]MDO6720313.1 SH3 domain-containing protein [Psychrosphaera sp. 1_MG-2023]